MRIKRFSRRDVLRNLLGGAIGIPFLGYSSTKKAPHLETDKFEKGMQVIITGSGSALVDPLRGNASAAVVVDGTILLFDCGRQVMDNLTFAGINPVDVDYIIFTHLHFDHIATYDYYIISSWIAGREKPFKVFGPPGTIKMSEGALFGKNELNTKWWMNRRNGEPPPVEVKDIGPGLILDERNIKVTATEVSHWGPGLGTTSLGYRVDSSYGSVAISGDTGPTQNMIDLAKGVDVLVHECTVPDPGMQKGGQFSQRDPSRGVDLSQGKTGHTNPTALGLLAKKAQVKKLVPTHLPCYMSVDAAVENFSLYYGPRQPRGIWTEFISAIKRQYSGPVIMAENAMVIDLGKP